MKALSCILLSSAPPQPDKYFFNYDIPKKFYGNGIPNWWKKETGHLGSPQEAWDALEPMDFIKSTAIVGNVLPFQSIFSRVENGEKVVIMKVYSYPHTAMVPFPILPSFSYNVPPFFPLLTKIIPPMTKIIPLFSPY